MTFQKGNKFALLRKDVSGSVKKQWAEGKRDHQKGKHYSPATEFKKGHRSLSGENHPNWKGDKISYSGIHDYIKYHLPKSKKCEDCGKIKKLDLANISGRYKRDLKDWKWICRKCHIINDKIVEKAWITRRKNDR